MPEKMQAVITLLVSLVGFVFIIALAYFLLRLLGKKYQTAASGTGYIKVMDRINVGPDRTLCIVRAAGKTMLLGVTPHHIELLGDLEEDKLVAPPPAAAVSPFFETLEQLMRGHRPQGKKEEGEEQDG